MQAFSIEKTIAKTESKIKNIFKMIKDKSNELDAYNMEYLILIEVLKLGKLLLEGYFAERGTGDIGPELKKDDTIFKKESRLYGRDYFSIFGKIKVPRSCYRTSNKPGIMPLDAMVNLPSRCYSYLLQEWMDHLVIGDSYEECKKTLNKLLGLNIHVNTLETINIESSIDYDKFYEVKQLASPETEGEIQVQSYDGKGVPVIKKEAANLQAKLGKGEKRQKKKEALVGVSYTVDKNIRTPEEVAENLIFPEIAKQKKEKEKKTEPPKAQNIRRMASLERSKEEVIKEISNDAKKRNPTGKRINVVLMDGALHLWNLVASQLSGIKFIGILDIIHVLTYLWDVGNALYGEKSKDGKDWVYKHLLLILHGNVGRVIGGLKQILIKRKLKSKQKVVLEKAIRYFENHKKWMCYNVYLKEGYPIGSGVVESSCCHTVKSRMEGSGRRWSIQGAESTLLLRSIYTSNDWDEYWQTHMNLEEGRLYKETLLAISSFLKADDYDLKKAA